jgi:hypothetical protein
LLGDLSHSPLKLAEELAADLAELDGEEYEYEEEVTVAGLSSAANWPPTGRQTELPSAHRAQKEMRGM